MLIHNLVSLIHNLGALPHTPTQNKATSTLAHRRLMRKHGMTVKEHEEFAEKLDRILTAIADWEYYLEDKDYPKRISQHAFRAVNNLIKLEVEMEEEARAEHPEVPVEEFGYSK